MKHNDTSKRLMSAALQRFSEQGYDNTTTKQIAETAGFNELTLFRYFGTKANLFQELTDYYMIDARVTSLLADIEELDSREAIRKISQHINERYEQNRNLFKVQMKLKDDADHLVKLKLSRSLIEELEGYFHQLIAKGIVQGDPHRMAITFVAGHLGLFTMDIMNPDLLRDTWGELSAEFVNQFIKTYFHK